MHRDSLASRCCGRDRGLRVQEEDLGCILSLTIPTKRTYSHKKTDKLTVSNLFRPFLDTDLSTTRNTDDILWHCNDDSDVLIDSSNSCPFKLQARLRRPAPTGTT